MKEDLTLTPDQLKKLEQYLDTIPHLYAKNIVGFLNQVAQENSKEKKTQRKEQQ